MPMVFTFSSSDIKLEGIKIYNPRKALEILSIFNKESFFLAYWEKCLIVYPKMQRQIPIVFLEIYFSGLCVCVCYLDPYSELFT